MLSFCYQFQNKIPENRIITQFSGICLLLPLAPCKSILNTFVYGIYQRVSVLFELSVKHTLSDFLLPFRCHEWRKFNSKKYR